MKEDKVAEQDAADLPAVQEPNRTELFQALISSLTTKADETSFPNLTREQAFFLSWVLDGNGVERTVELFSEEFGTLPEVEKWMLEDDFRRAVELSTTDRKQLMRAMALALAGSSFRALAWMMDQPSAAAKEKAVTLLLRMHGMLIDKVRRDSPSQFRELLERLRKREHVIEGEYKVVGTRGVPEVPKTAQEGSNE